MPSTEKVVQKVSRLFTSHVAKRSAAIGAITLRTERQEESTREKLLQTGRVMATEPVSVQLPKWKYF
jgi:hypothetical protein